MKKYISILGLFGAFFFAACGEVPTLEQSCADHGGVKPNSIEKENDGSSEARCNDNTETETEGPGQGWYAEEE